MNDSFLIQTHTRMAMAARDTLSIKRLGAVGALILMLVFSAVMLVSSPPVQAQDPAVTAEVITVNINTADAQTLATTLKGVGQTRALEIIRYREAYGPFASVDELTEVKGIGISTLDMNRQRIILE